MRITEHAEFTVQLSLNPKDAHNFVAHIEYPLAEADFLRNVHISGTEPRVVHAEIPVKAGMFGQHSLRFASEVHVTETGAQLVPVLEPGASGWAELAGNAVVQSASSGSVVTYDFTFSLELQLPGVMRWGEGALTKMIEVTAKNILSRLTEAFPRTIQAAAVLYENELLAHAEVRENRG